MHDQQDGGPHSHFIIFLLTAVSVVVNLSILKFYSLLPEFESGLGHVIKLTVTWCELETRVLRFPQPTDWSQFGLDMAKR